MIVSLMAAAIGFTDSSDARAIAPVLPTVAARVPDTLGSLALNPSGDLDRAEYDIWRILGVFGSKVWSALVDLQRPRMVGITLSGLDYNVSLCLCVCLGLPPVQYTGFVFLSL